MRYVITEEGIDKRFVAYYKVVHKRFERAGKAPEGLKKVCSDIYYKFVTLQRTREDVHPTALYLYPPKVVLENLEMFMLGNTGNRVRPTSAFCKYLPVTQVNEVTYVNTLERELIKVREEFNKKLKDSEEKASRAESKADTALHEIAKTQKVLISLIDRGLFTPIGIEPPGDEEKAKGILKLPSQEEKK